MNSSPSLQRSLLISPRASATNSLEFLLRNRLALSLLLFAATFLLFSPMSGYEFINYDDQLYVTENYVVQQGLTLRGFKWTLTGITGGNWHPVTMLSHMLDVELFGLNPVAHHYVNLGLHSLNVVLLFLFLCCLTGRVTRSLLVSAVFAVHPLAVESVMWIAERKNLLCTLFSLLALKAYIHYVREPSFWRKLTITCFYLLALLSKPMVVTLPFVLLLLDYWPLHRWQVAEEPSLENKRNRVSAGVARFGELVREKAPWFFMAFLDSVVTLYAQHKEGAVTANYLPFGTRLGNAALSYGRYLLKAVFPTRLCVFYPHPKLALPWGEVALAGAMLILITVLVIRYRANAAYLTVGWLWFLGTLVPVIGIVQAGSQAMADRYAYIPLIGIFVAIVWTASDLLSKVSASKTPAIVLFCLLLLLLGWRTRVQEAYWRNSLTLFSHALDVTRENPVAHVNLGMALATKGLPEEAIAHVRAALAINPNDAVALQGLALYDAYHGDTTKALDELNKAAALSRYPFVQERIRMNLGALYSKLGEMERAKLEYAEAIRLQPEDYKPYLNLGVHLYLEGKYEQALGNINQSISVFPTSTAHYYQGQALEAEGKLEASEQSYRRALELSPEFDDARTALDNLLGKMRGRPSPAR